MAKKTTNRAVITEELERELNKELERKYAALVERGMASFQKARILDELFCSHAPLEKINQFFCENQEILPDIFQAMICCNNLFSLDLIAAVDVSNVRAICMFLKTRRTMSFFCKMRYCASVIMSKWIPDAKRALFWNVMTDLSYPWSGVPEESFTRDVFIDNEDSRRALLYHKKDGEKCDFIRNTELSRRELEGTPEFLEGIRQDSVSIFEMHRQMAGRKITITMLLYLLRFDAVKCFTYLLTHFSKQVYKCRSPEEWLFTVCRNTSADTAIPIIRSIEEDKPGIVASSRDPWGNTLLWNMLQNRNSVKNLQNVLISLGCDPDALNQWGLSFRIVKKNRL